MAKENSQGNRRPKSTKKKTVKKKSPAKKSPKPNAGRIECKYSKLEPINKLNPNPQNPNIHTEEQIHKLADLIRLHGWRLPIIVSDRSGLIVAGHGRLLAAKKLGLDAAPVDFQSFKNEAEEYAVLISDNVIAELSSFDGLKMAELLNELDVFNVDLEKFTALNKDEIDNYILGPDGLGDDFDLPDGDGSDSQQMTFVVTNEQAEQIKQAMQKANEMGAYVGTGNQNENGNSISRICETFNGLRL